MEHNTLNYMQGKHLRSILGPLSLAGSIALLTACGGSSGPKDAVPPTLSLNGEKTVEFILGHDQYQELGAEATDDVDGIRPVEIGGDTVDDSKAGTYTVMYSATDLAGNVGSIARYVTIREPKPFITTWQVDDTTLEIPLNPEFAGMYDYSVDWGDGSVSSDLNDTANHTYDQAGKYTVTISGDFPAIMMGNTKDKASELIEINQWGELPWKSMKASFKGASSLEIKATDTPYLLKATDLSEAFYGARMLADGLKDWDVSNVTTMKSMFESALLFNGDISGWDVSSVTDMSKMFYNAREFNQPIGNWDVSSVTNMHAMFMTTDGPTDKFNQPLNQWDVSNVTYMGAMFYRSIYNHPLDKWNVAKVTSMASMFRRNHRFNQPIGNWNVASVTDMGSMFEDAGRFNQDIGNWNVSSVRSMNRMFKGAYKFGQDIGGWDFSNIKNMASMFSSPPTYSAMTRDQIDNLLIGLAGHDSLNKSVSLGMSSHKYSSKAKAAREKLVNEFKWFITDGGCAGVGCTP